MTDDLRWKDASFEGIERLQFRQTAKMSMPERLAAVDGMLSFACSMKPEEPMVVAEEVPVYKADSK